MNFFVNQGPPAPGPNPPKPGPSRSKGKGVNVGSFKERHICPVCKVEFNSKEKLVKHIKQKHKSKVAG